MDIEESREFEGYSILNYWARGHVDHATFLDAVWDQHMVIGHPDFVRDVHYRLIPVRDHGSLLLVESKPGRGAFKATTLEYACQPEIQGCDPPPPPKPVKRVRINDLLAEWAKP